MIPNIIHFIFGLKSDFGNAPFSFIHYLAIKSAHDCNQPEVIKFYYRYEPSGEWWEKSKPYLKLIQVEPPQTIFGNPLLHYAHQADVLRLEILLKEGGIYLDIDVICLHSFKPLLKYQCVMGYEGQEGPCNAVILAEPQAPFLKLWYKAYHSFRSKGHDEFYAEHSVYIPGKLAKKNRHLIHIEDEFAFFWPWVNQRGVLWAEDYASKKPRWKTWLASKIFRQAYCIHLWQTLWWKDHLKDLSKDYVLNKRNYFSMLCKKFILEGKSEEFYSQKSNRIFFKIISFFLWSRKGLKGFSIKIKKKFRTIFQSHIIFYDDVLSELDQKTGIKKYDLGGIGKGENQWITVNLSSDPNIKEDILNLDSYSVDNSVDVFRLIHTYEHIPLVHLEKFVKKIMTKLKPGGCLIVVHTDIKKTLQLYKQGKIDFYCLRDIIMSPILERQKSAMETGGRDLFHHQFMWGEEELREELLSYGFSKVKIMNVNSWSFDVPSHFSFQKNEKFFGTRIPNLGIIAYK